MGFHAVVLVKTFPLMYQLPMYDWQWRSYGDFSSSAQVKIRISNFKKNQIFGFPCCSTREDLSIDVSITNVGPILMKLWWFLFSGYGQMDRRIDRQTDMVLESSYWNMSAHKKFQLKTQNYWLAVDPYTPPRRTGMHNNTALYIWNWQTLLHSKFKNINRELLIWKIGRPHDWAHTW